MFRSGYSDDPGEIVEVSYTRFGFVGVLSRSDGDHNALIHRVITL